MNTVSWKRQTVAWLVALATVVFANGEAKAGDVLRFKTGVVRTNNFDAGPIWLRHAIRNPNRDARYHVVQFSGKIGRDEHRQLKILGAKVFRYVPDDALIIRASAASVERIQSEMPGVRAVVPFFAGWKLSPEFAPGSIFARGKYAEVFIQLLDASESKAIVRAMGSISGAEVKTADGRTIVATVDLGQLEQIASLEGVEWIQPNPKMELHHFVLNDQEQAQAAPVPVAGDYSDLTGYESGTKIMNFDAVWARGYEGTGQTVAMSDTGLDMGDVNKLHKDFMGRAIGQYFGIFSASWEDPMGHGTHVSGSIVGDGAESSGQLRGGAPKARLVAQSMWSPLLAGLSVPSKVTEMFGHARQEGATIHSNSWGSPRNLGAYDAFAMQIDEFMFTNPDSLVVFSAGNNGQDADKDGRIDADSVGSPGTAKNVLTVGASENKTSVGGIQNKLGELRGGAFATEPLASDTISNNENGIAVFSSRGPTDDGRTKPDVVAPGTNILSARSHHPDAQVLWGEYNTNYVWSGGTSMSTPLVAGAAVLVREYLQREKNIANPSAALLKAVLMHTAVDLFPGQYGKVGKAKGQEILTTRPNSDEGYGRVDVSRATGLRKAMLIDERLGVATGENMRYPLNVKRDGKLTVTLVWTDAPASPNSQLSLVNDLDVVLIAPDGKETILGDRLNNNELIEARVAVGAYEVQVRGSNVPQGMDGKQPFALVVSIE